jgi:hypothetical protein
VQARAGGDFRLLELAVDGRQPVLHSPSLAHRYDIGHASKPTSPRLNTSRVTVAA